MEAVFENGLEQTAGRRSVYHFGLLARDDVSRKEKSDEINKLCLLKKLSMQPNNLEND